MCGLFLIAQEHAGVPFRTQPRDVPKLAAAQASSPNLFPPPEQGKPHPAFGERVQERQNMVNTQIKLRGITDPNVVAAMHTVPRHVFVLPQYQAQAYADHPLPIDHNQTISQPYIVAFMTAALALEPNDRVLEIGTGSGYQAAVCCEIAKAVYSI